MDNKIKEGLLEITPDLEESKQRIKHAVLQPQVKTNKGPNFLFPKFIFSCCFVLLAALFVITELQSDGYESVKGYSEKTVTIYDAIGYSEPEDAYQKDLIIAEYGKLKGVKVKKEEVKKLVESYISETPTNVSKSLEKKQISEKEYEKKYLILKAQVQLIRDALLPTYAEKYPQLHQEVYSDLLLLDAMKKVNADDNVSLALSDTNVIQNFSAIVLYEGNNKRVLALTDENGFLNLVEQPIIMPIRDSLHLNVGDELSLKNCSITGVSTVESYKYFAACQDIKVLAKDTTKAISIMPKKVETFIEQNTWQPMSIKREPDKKIKSLNAVYSVWYNSDDIVLGKEDKGIVISKEKLQKWAEVLMNN